MENEFDELDEEEEEEGETWMASYSDMMTDLLAVFVILFSFAMAATKVMTTAGAMDLMDQQSVSIIDSTAGGGQGVMPGGVQLPQGAASLTPPGKGGEGQSGQEEGADGQHATKGGEEDDEGSGENEPEYYDLFHAMQAYILEAGLTGKLSVSEEGDNIILLRMADSALFSSGKADIGEQAQEVMTSISDILTAYADYIRIVRIEGHTDNRPIHNAQFNSNWELSMTRAVTVLRHMLLVSGLAPNQLSAVGYSEFHPIASNDTDEGQARNRRVDFIIETKPST